MTTRREFIAGAVAAAGMAALSPAIAASQKSAIDRHFGALMHGIGLNLEETGGTIMFNGSEPLFPSATPLATAFALPAMACGAGAAINWRQRGGAGQNISIDIEQAAHGVFPEMTANPSLNGGPYRTESCLRYTRRAPYLCGIGLSAPDQSVVEVSGL